MVHTTESILVIFGDSITHGAYDEELGGFVNRLKLKLERNHRNYYNVYNLGVPGANTNEILNRFENECMVRLDPTLETIIIFFIGINDSSYKNDVQDIKLANYKSNISKLIEKAKKFSDNIIFLGLTKVDESKVTPVNWDNNLCYCNDSIKAYDAVLKETCRNENVEYLDLFDVIIKSDLSDGLHPNANGHKKIGEKIIKKLKKIF